MRETVASFPALSTMGSSGEGFQLTGLISPHIRVSIHIPHEHGQFAVTLAFTMYLCPISQSLSDARLRKKDTSWR